MITQVSTIQLVRAPSRVFVNSHSALIRSCFPSCFFALAPHTCSIMVPPRLSERSRLGTSLQITALDNGLRSTLVNAGMPWHANIKPAGISRYIVPEWSKALKQSTARDILLASTSNTSAYRYGKIRWYSMMMHMNACDTHILYIYERTASELKKREWIPLCVYVYICDNLYGIPVWHGLALF